jgi:UDP-glucose 4-epimerase
VLVTRGAGYIGSHTCVELLNAGKEIVVIDNFCNSKPKSLRRVRKIRGKAFREYRVDLLDCNGVEQVLKENEIAAVIHFAGLKSVGESMNKPLQYYHNNVMGSLFFLKLCKRIM